MCAGDTWALDPAGRGAALETNARLACLHLQQQQQGETAAAAAANTNMHFTCLLPWRGFVIELDGRKPKPLIRAKIKPCQTFAQVQTLNPKPLTLNPSLQCTAAVAGRRWIIWGFSFAAAAAAVVVAVPVAVSLPAAAVAMALPAATTVCLPAAATAAAAAVAAASGCL